jgi:hypothetical protein
MIDTFLITIPKDTIIYRGKNDKNELIGNWFAYDKEDALSYGSIHSFKLNKDIKLINLINGFFHIDYMDKLNLKFTGNNYDGNDLRKMLALFPIGLPKLETQIELSKKVHGTNFKETDNKDIIFLSSYIYDITRFSDYNIDKDFAKIIMEIYGDKCDGFTIPIKWPNKIQGGLFNREIYIKDISMVEVLDNLKKNISGGSVNKIININMFNSEKEYRERIQKVQEQMNESIKNI